MACPSLSPRGQAALVADGGVRLGLGETAARGVAHDGPDELGLRYRREAAGPPVGLQARVGDGDRLLGPAQQGQGDRGDVAAAALDAVVLAGEQRARGGQGALRVPLEQPVRGQAAEQLQAGEGVGDHGQGLVEHRVGGPRITHQVVEVVGPGVGDPGQFGVGTAQRDRGGERGLGFGVPAGTEPALPQHQARLRPAARIEGSLREPGGELEVEHLGGPPGRAGEQRGVSRRAGVELPAAQAQQIVPAAGSGRLDGAGQRGRYPPHRQAGQALAQRLTVDRVGQPDLGPPPVLAHDHQPLGFGVLQAGRIGEPFQDRHAQRLARREQLDHRDRLRGQPGEPGRHQFHQPAGRGQRLAQGPDTTGLDQGTGLDRADQQLAPGVPG